MAPPAVVSTKPADGFKRHPIDTGITITFNMNMDYQSLPGQIHLRRTSLPHPELDVEIYPATPTGPNREFRVFPAGGDKLSDEVEYTVAVSEQVTDLAGRKMTAPFSFSFKAVSKRFKQVSAGEGHTCAVKESGHALCWGENFFGQLGDGTTQDRKRPTPVQGLGVIKRISAGKVHTCALYDSGQMKCWGNNQDGQLGDGTLQHRSLPTPVVDISNAVSMGAGNFHTCARLENGFVKCWGSGVSGAVGNGKQKNELTPNVVVQMANVRRLAVGGDHNCALLTNGLTKCWGRNLDGQLGNGTKEDEHAPIVIPLVSQATEIAAGDTQTCAIVSGDVSCWGFSHGLFPTPFPVNGMVDLTLGDFFALGRNSFGTVVGWGKNDFGQLGDGTLQDSLHTITGVNGLNDAFAVDAGSFHACAILYDRSKLECWGANESGNLGDGTTTLRKTPVPIDY